MSTARATYLSDPDVAQFAQWMAEQLPLWPVRLQIPHSPFVPGGITGQTTFGALVPEHFRWRLAGMAVGDWWETARTLRALSQPLRVAVTRDDAPATMAACEAIALWAADRNCRVGAIAFLSALGKDLPSYLKGVRHALRLDSTQASDDFGPVLRMNSTLSKIHALYAADGLPIYESRVAAAIATLVELWRRQTDRADEPLPEVLRFPSAGSQQQRRLRQIFPDAADPGTLSYAGATESVTAMRWSDAAVRLGRLTQEMLRRSDANLFVAWPGNAASGTPAARAATFTAALFMAGYDPNSFSQPRASVSEGVRTYRNG